MRIFIIKFFKTQNFIEGNEISFDDYNYYNFIPLNTWKI